MPMPQHPSRRRFLLGMAGLAGLAGLGGPAAFRALAAARGLASRTRAGLAFGTTVALTAAGPDPAALDAGLSDGFAALRTVEAAASLFRADSALSRLNRDGWLDAPPAGRTRDQLPSASHAHSFVAATSESGGHTNLAKKSPISSAETTKRT